MHRLELTIVAQIAVIGEKTTAAIAEYGYQADFMPTYFVAEQFATEFAAVLEKNREF